MPLTNAEKIRRFRERKKQSDPDFQKNENARINQKEEGCRNV